MQIQPLSIALNTFLVGNFIYQAWINQTILKPFNIALSMILLGFVCSMISSNIFEGTNPWDAYKGGLFIFSIFLFVLLESTNTQREDVEKALVWLSLAYCSFYIIQFIALQFGIAWVAVRDFADEQGMDARLRITGSALSGFAYCYGLCKLWTKEGNKVVNIALIALGALVIILMAFRTLIASAAVVTLILAIKTWGFNLSSLRNIFLGCIFAVGITFIPTVQNKIEYMQNKQTEGTQTLANKDYIRWINLEYHYNDYFKNNTEMFFGSGITASKGTNYSKKLNFLAESHMMYVDWGILGLTWMVGIITVFGMLYYCWRALRIRYDKEDSFIYIFFLYLIFGGIITNEFARPGNFAIQALVLYLAYDICWQRIEEKELEEELEYEELEPFED